MSEIVIVTGARAPVAQDLARALRAAGCQVLLADSVPAFAARAMRPAYEVHRLPAPRQAFAQFRVALSDLVERSGATRIVPSCEEVFWVSEAARLEGFEAAVFAPSIDRLRQLHSKAEFAAMVADLGLVAPDTQVIDSAIVPTELAAPLEDLVFKPEFSRFASETRISPTARDLANVRPTPQRRWVAQRRIRGEEICAWASLHGGRVTAFAAYCPRWRLGHAAAFQVEAVDAPGLRALADRIGAATAMSGHLSFDAIVDGDGRTYPIECNPRAVSGLHLFDASAALGQAILGAPGCLQPPMGRLRHLGPAMALLGLPVALGEARLGDLVTDWRASRDVIDRDGQPLVTLGCLADAARFAAAGVLGGRSAAAASTADIEWDGEAMA